MLSQSTIHPLWESQDAMNTLRLMNSFEAWAHSMMDSMEKKKKMRMKILMTMKMRMMTAKNNHHSNSI